MLTRILFLVLITIAPLSWGRQHVYLVHGFGSNPLTMWGMERYLDKAGYATTNWGYRSISLSIPEIGVRLHKQIRERTDIDTVSFVTHSMGGIVVRAMMGEAQGDTLFPTIHRIVMLSPPNKGSELADFFAQFEVLRWILGPNLGNMTTEPSALVHSLPKTDGEELGIVAGARFDGEGYNAFIEGDNDGFITPDRMKLGSEKDFVVIPEVHFFMPQNKQAKIYVLHFLRTGSFVDSSTNK